MAATNASNTTGKWETVVNKKKSHVTKSDVKKAQQKFIDGEKVPKVDHRDPLKLDQTMYAAGFERQQIEDDADEKYPSRLPYDSTDNSLSPRVRKQKKLPKPAAPVDVSAKIRKLDPNVIAAQIKENDVKFPNQKLICLKYLTGWLQSELAGPNEKTDFAYLTKPAEYPLCEVHEEVRNILSKFVRKSDANTLSAYFTFLVASLTAETQQSHSTLAQRIMIQLLYTIQPNIFVESCDEIVHGKSRNADSYLAVIWAFSQVTSNLEHGLSVWWSCMYSVLDKKHHANASVQYFDRLIRLHGNKKATKALVTPDQMVQLMELMVSEKSPLQHTPGLMDQMRNHFKTLSSLLLCGGNANMVFQQLLPSVKQYADSDMKYMLCELLLECLYSTRSTMEWWSQHIVHHMKESSILLKHIQSKSNQVNKEFTGSRQYKSKYALFDYSTIMRTNLDKANEKGKFEKKAGFKDCRKLCNNFIRIELERKNETSKLWTFMKLSLFVLLLVAGIDIYRSQSYNESNVGVYLKRYGVESRALYVMEYTRNITDDATSFVGKHAPHYYSKVSVYIDPVLEKTSSYITIASKFVYKHSEPLRAYLNKVLPPLFEKVSFFLSEQYRIISGLIIATYEKYTPIIQDGVLSTYSWLCVAIPNAYNYTIQLVYTTKQQIYQLNPVFFDSLRVYIDDAIVYVVKVTPVVMETVRNYTSTCAKSTQKYFSAGQIWLQQNLANASPAATK